MSPNVFTCEHRVAYSECTLGDHVYYARYLDILERARGEFFRSVGAAFLELQNQETIFPVIECRTRYKSAARYDDVLQIQVWLDELEGIRLSFQHKILRGETLILEASTSHICTDLNNRPRRLPEELMERLAPFLAR